MNCSFFKNSKSSVLIIFALALPSIVLMVTYVVDISNIVYNGLVLQTSVDAASLAGIRASSIAAGGNAARRTQGIRRATVLYNANKVGLQYAAGTTTYDYFSGGITPLTVSSQLTISLWFRALWSAVPIVRVTSVASRLSATNFVLSR